MKNRKILAGIIAGSAAGMIDSSVMLLRQSQPHDVLAAFAFWVVAGLVISITRTGIKGAAKGLALSLILLVPIGIPIVWKDPSSFLPMAAFTAFLGAAIGYIIERFHG